MSFRELVELLQLERGEAQRKIKERFIQNRRTGMTFAWHKCGNDPTVDALLKQQKCFPDEDVYKKGDTIDLITRWEHTTMIDVTKTLPL